MPKLSDWSQIPPAVKAHLIQRMHERQISLNDLNRLRLWIETTPNVPEGKWYKDFGSFKICGEGALPKTFLIQGQIASGTEV